MRHHRAIREFETRDGTIRLGQLLKLAGIAESGADAAKFQINAATGALSFVTAPTFENPTDADRNNAYVVQVRASDGSLVDDQTVTVSITNLDEAPLTLHWAASVDVGSHPAGWSPVGIGR